ncbi:Uma2 family endonuclease [Streptomyces triculaminicus]|uniref:Uma2 family endonuclease n=2 Tax=Streptomyces TaxID=1883 RepID=A0A939JM40_9ACTN|nr:MULTISPECIES: Uma2 family endonuclease [Streptomyces]MBO0651958.1 Uma2 family endonuclease [Streptomyces triculaminicus]QSY47130.1 Uma2 family endonuclease [Streptomyces griseocarneus]
MTPSTADQPLLLAEEFEELARMAPETVRLEFINGKIEVKPVPDGDHDEIIMWLRDICTERFPNLRLYGERGLKVESYRKGRARPDGLLAPHRHFSGHGEWSDPDGLLMVVEVTSHDTDTNRRDRIEKRDGYAAADIPVYLLIDREHGTVTVYSEPKDGTYQSLTARPYGTPIELPAPVGFTLETEELKAFAQ